MAAEAGVSPYALRRPAPPHQLREALEVARRRGDSFDEAWVWAMRQVIWPHDTVHRQQWRRALRATREEWEAAYTRMPTRCSAILRDFEPTVYFTAME